MKIAAGYILFPVVKLRADISFRLLPELTPIHHALEEIVKRFSDGRNELSLAPLVHVFREMFGLSGASEILPQVLDDLLDRKYIHSVNKEWTDHTSIRAVDLAHGPGEPGVPVKPNFADKNSPFVQSMQLERFYDPVLGEIVSANNLFEPPLTDSIFKVPVSPFLKNPPIEWVEDEVKSETRDDLKVIAAEAEVIGHTWRRCQADLFLLEGVLSVECHDSRQSEYLRGLSPRARCSLLSPDCLAGSFGEPADGIAERSIFPWLYSDAKSIALIASLPQRVLDELFLPETDLVVSLNPVGGISEPTLQSISENLQALQVVYPRKDIVTPPGIYFADMGYEYASVPVSWEGLEAELGLFQQSRGFHQVDSGLGEVMATLETECRFSDHAEIFVLPAYWLEPTQFVKLLSDRFSHEPVRSEFVLESVKAIKRFPFEIREPIVRLLASINGSKAILREKLEIAGLLTVSVPSQAAETGREQSSEELPDACERVVAFDTSSLISDGQLVANLKPSDFLVIPQVIAGEVERMKTASDQFRVASRANLRAVDQLPPERWVAPFHDFSLLSPSDKKNNDGALIASLIPYCGSGREVILVSEDHDFVLRCQPYGIKWMPAREFLKPV
jgi:hypothetical protein